jgi:Arc/MetJ-type ribon-helix-helix transcriptional regulator
MRLQINLDDELLEELDRRIGRGRRSTFIAETVRNALRDEQRWEDIEAGLGALSDAGHAWDANPAEWVRAQRRGDSARVG